jgi:hypothetical protein
MPSRNKKNGGKGGKTCKRLDSLTSAYVKVIQTSKQIQNLKSSMAPVVMREILDGLDDGNKIYTEHKPYLFLGRAEPTQCVEDRKINKVFNLPEVGDLEYDLDFLTVKNEKDRATGLYFPDILGRKSPKSLKTELHERIQIGVGPSTSTQKKLHSELCDEHSHKFLSIILKNSDKFNAGVRAFTTKLTDDAKLMDEINKTIYQLGSPKNGFRDEKESFDVIPTSDYTIHVIGTKHSINKTHFNLEIKKRLVVATFRDRSKNESSDGLHIPVVEEMSIQVKFPDKSNIKGIPLFVNHEELFLIYCALGHHDKATLGDANLHYFGDNAFSVHFDIDDEKKMQDKTKTCLHLAGNVMKKIIDINSTNYNKMKSSIHFFNGMFSDTSEAFDHKSILKLGAQIVPDGVSQRLFKELNTEEKREEKKIRSVEEVYSVLHSFLKRQNIRGLLEVNAGRGCNIEKWISSSTFSVLSLSSFKTPHKKYVFVLTYTGIRKRTLSQISPSRSQFTPPDPNKTSINLNVRAQVRSNEISGRSLLSPDLEEELDILFR